jgi:hypothetical protein
MSKGAVRDIFAVLNYENPENIRAGDESGDVVAAEEASFGPDKPHSYSSVKFFRRNS